MLHLKRSFPRRAKDLTDDQRLMYSREKLMNFRWISRVCATKSPVPLLPEDMVHCDLHLELGALGQFAEVAYGLIEPGYVFSHLDALTAPDFPLEGYDALPGTTLVAHLRGSVADLQGYVAYRHNRRQLVAAFSGTRSAAQAYNDTLFLKRAYPRQTRCEVHLGFWNLYKGVVDQAMEAIIKAFELHPDVEELVVTGHSMGAAMAYLLALDMLREDPLLDLRGVAIKVAVFGCPRVGDAALVEYWQERVGAYRKLYGIDAVLEYSVKAYMDGVPSIPPVMFGYQHFCRNPIYLYHDRFYRVPESECEHGLFDVVEGAPADAGTDRPAPLFPRGGHNYYGRDWEKFARRMEWVGNMIEGEDWETRYRERVAKYERRVTTARKGLLEDEELSPK